MNNKKQCDTCGEIMKPSQYASRKQEGHVSSRENEHLVCLNYPKCEKAEKSEIDSKVKG